MSGAKVMGTCGWDDGMMSGGGINYRIRTVTGRQTGNNLGSKWFC